MFKVFLTCNTELGIGGQGGCLANAAEAFSKLADLTVFTAGVKAPDANFSVQTVGYSRASERLLSIPVLRRRTDWAVLLSDLHFDRQVSKRLQTQKCDLIMGVAAQTHLAFKEAKKKGAKAWLYCLNNYLPFMQQQIQEEQQFLNEPTVATMNPQMLRRFTWECEEADLIVVLSQVAKKTFIQAGFPPEKVAVLTPSINSYRFRPAAKNDSVFRVLYVGSIGPRKGVHYLIPAFLKANIANSELLLVGGASTRVMRLLLEKTLAENSHVKQEGWNFNVHDPVPVFSRASVLVLPSVEDGFGLVALEAMACGLPVIVTSNCGAADVVEDGVNGFVIPPRDEKSLAEKLTFLAANESIRESMGIAARSTAVAHNQEFYNQALQQILIAQGLGANL
ncbi:glycosyltransferase family 4 protein [Iningainema tapete]|uniref:Glycosyltransferase family 4 protein n=1 Tax=Iningainema tapete BLCC-T55 TaxID=2748662 RepID=A0A8J6XDY1_9CYAN|nr:glycosyltransferase family 4 protein [Iningainema tapete]MBD2774455.1 glycosyltransferase family 4 protein [Iningainema tapete BLCC-T55]